MKLTIRKCIITVLLAVVSVCAAFGIAACKKESHNFSNEWSYDDTGHWHACLDDGCDEISDYAEHTPTDEGTSLNGYVYYTCEVCGAEYRSDLYTYIVYVKNIGNAGVAGVEVNLYDASSNVVGTGTSGTNGTIRFRNLSAGNYTATVTESTIPTGYSAEDGLTVSFTSDYRASTIYLTPHVITADEATEPSSVSYTLGSIMYDHTFTVYYHDGTNGSVTLSELLKEYDAVMIQFFYTTCSPCMQEFPYINQVYNLTQTGDGGNYYDSVFIIECDYAVYDSLSDLTNFATKSSYSYDNIAYNHDSDSYYNKFGVESFPTTVIVDRYGVVSAIDEGSRPTRSYWTNLFDTYIGDDYTPNYASSNGTDDDEDSTTAKPTESMPESGEIASAIVSANYYTSVSGTSASDTGTFEFSAYYEDGVLDEYSWPWLISDGTTAKDGVTNYIYTSNANQLGTYAILVIDVKLTAGQVFMFDYTMSTEEEGDYLYIQVDTVLQAQLSGITSGWTTFYYVAQQTGYYQITLLYQKNTSVDEDEDMVYVSNMRLGALATSADASQFAAADILSSSTTVANPDMLYNAATAYDTDSTVQSSYYAGTGYGDNYVSVYLASDGFYRVDLDGDNKDGDVAEESDPYLLADLYYTTPWNDTYSIWYIAYVYMYTYDYTDTSTSTSDDDDDPTTGKGWLYDNLEACQLLEDYAWIQTSSPFGYTPVTEELATVLKAVTASYGTTAQESNANQWLEVCRYYIHYGADSSDHDCKSLDNLAETYGIRMPAKTGITVNSANTAGNEATFHAEMPEVISPRGFYYSFTVETSGVYLIYTTEPLHDEDGNEEDGTYGNNPYIWITDSEGYEVAENDTYYLSAVNADGSDYTDSTKTAYYDDNAYVYCYLEAGEYMVGCTLSYIYDTGDYDVCIRFLGETYTYFTAAAVNEMYTYTETTDATTGETTYYYYIPAVYASLYMDDDGYYWAVNDDGSMSALYINMTGVTYLNSSYSSYTLEQAINSGAWSGTAYDAVMKDYLALAKANTGVASDGTSLTGYVQADEMLAAILTAYANGSDTSSSSTYADTAWLMTAYYERVLNLYTVSDTRIIDD